MQNGFNIKNCYSYKVSEVFAIVFYVKNMNSMFFNVVEIVNFKCQKTAK